MHNITIGICCGGQVCAETITSLIAAIDLCRDKGVGVNLSIQVGGYTAHNRNKLVEVAKQNESTHIMFIDADQTFPASGIVRLLDHDKDVVGAAYNARRAPGDTKPIVSTVKLADEEGNLIGADSIPAQLFKAFAVGTGFMMIKMSVFDNLPKPYFVAWEDEDGSHHTEDVDFCDTLHKKGIEVWCSPTIKVGHIGSYLY